MFKTKKSLAFLIVSALIFLSISCISTEDEITRTQEMETEELDAALASLTSQGYDIQTTDLGVFYIIQKEGEGAYAMSGDTLSLNYTGYLLDGTVFDASGYYYADSLWEFVYKEVHLIPGFDDALSLMNKGTELYFIIPSDLAYGAYGSGIIPPYSSIIFSTKLEDIKSATE